jgi:hypothetical protein
VIDPIVPRYTALLKEEVVPVHVKDASTGVMQKPRHPKVREIEVLLVEVLCLYPREVKLLFVFLCLAIMR